MRIRLEGRAAHALFDADLAQHLHRIGHHLDARADARKARRLFVDLHVDADAAQRGRGGQPADARADNRKCQFFLAHLVRFL